MVAKSKHILRYIIVGIVTIILLAVIGALLFIGITLSSLNDSIALKRQEVFSAFDARKEALFELTDLLEDKMSLDRDAFESLYSAQKQLDNAKTDEEISNANIQVDAAIDNLIFVMKDKYLYLEGEEVQAAEEKITTANNRIVIETVDYNKDVLDYNATASTFPGNAIISILGYNESETVFEIIAVSRG